MGTEDPDRSNFSSRPAASPFSSPQSTIPFTSSPPVVGPASQTTSPFISSRPTVGSERPSFRPTPPIRSTAPSVNPSQPSYGQMAAGPFQRAPAPLFPSTAQMQPPHSSPMGRPVFPPPTEHSAGHLTSMPAFSNQQPHTPLVPIESPPQSINSVPSSMKFPQSSTEASYFAPRSNLQQSSAPTRPSYPAAPGGLAFPGYPGKQPNAVAQTSPLSSTSFLNHQSSYVPPPPVVSTPFLTQGGYAPPPTVATLGPYSRDQIRAPGSTHSIGAAQGLVEDFNSLSIGSVPGSFDPGLDAKALPRPLDGDLEPKGYAEMYPMNCSSRYLRLTTSAIPTSQSLASRWHLPLGAVVCPLAEAPAGEEVPVVNFATTGIIRCKRCRTYINPYVIFTDGGRKWQCNICALLNEGKLPIFGRRSV